MSRLNRFDPKNADHVDIRKEPSKWTRRSRRSAGLRGPEHAARPWGDQLVLPRYVRRHFKSLVQVANGRRHRKANARINRAMARYAR